MFVASQLKIEHGVCASVRAVCTGCPGETNALAKASYPGNGRVLDLAAANIVVYHYVLVVQGILKALGISSGGQTARFQKGSGVPAYV